jgi:hypothetical protein
METEENDTSFVDISKGEKKLAFPYPNVPRIAAQR